MPRETVTPVDQFINETEAQAFENIIGQVQRTADALAMTLAANYGVPISWGPPGSGFFWDFQPGHDWYNFDSGVLIDSAQRAVTDIVTQTGRSISTISPSEVLDHPAVRPLFGKVQHEAGHKEFSDPETVKDMLSKPGFMFYYNAWSDAGEADEGAIRKRPGAAKDIEAYLDEDLSEGGGLDYKSINKDTKKSLGYVPKHMQYGGEMLHYYRDKRFKGKCQSDQAVEEFLKEIPDEAVREAVRDTKHDFEQFYKNIPNLKDLSPQSKRQAAQVRAGLLRKNYPIYEKLVEESHQDQALVKMIEDAVKRSGGQGQPIIIPFEVLPKDLQDEIREEMKKRQRQQQGQGSSQPQEANQSGQGQQSNQQGEQQAGQSSQSSQSQGSQGEQQQEGQQSQGSAGQSGQSGQQQEGQQSAGSQSQGQEGQQQGQSGQTGEGSQSQGEAGQQASGQEPNQQEGQPGQQSSSQGQEGEESQQEGEHGAGSAASQQGQSQAESSGASSSQSVTQENGQQDNSSQQNQGQNQEGQQSQGQNQQAGQPSDEGAEGHEGQAQPTPWEKILNDKEQRQKVKDFYDKNLTQEQKQKFEQEAKEDLESAEDAAVEKMRGDMLDPKKQETNKERHQREQQEQAQRQQQEQEQREQQREEQRQQQQQEAQKVQKKMERERAKVKEKSPTLLFNETENKPKVGIMTRYMTRNLRMALDPTEAGERRYKDAGTRLRMRRAAKQEIGPEHSGDTKRNNVFETKGEPLERSHSIVFLLDCSGSRAGQMDGTFNFVVSSANTTNKIRIPNAYVGFSDYFSGKGYTKVYKSLDDKRLTNEIRANLSEIPGDCSGGTPTKEATIETARQYQEWIKRHNTEYNFLITITDGACTSCSPAEMVKTVDRISQKNKNMVMIGIGIGPGTEFTNQSYSQLPLRVKQAIAAVLHKPISEISNSFLTEEEAQVALVKILYFAVRQPELFIQKKTLSKHSK